MRILTLSNGNILTELAARTILSISSPVESDIEGRKYWYFNIEYAATRNSTSNMNATGKFVDVHSDYEKLLKFMDEVEVENEIPQK